jgi:hypothetical protein
MIKITISFIGRMFAVGLSQGPPHHYWYLWLDRYISPQKVGLKILADQLLAAPFFAYTFFLGMGLLERKTVSQVNGEFVKKFPTVYVVSMLYRCFHGKTSYRSFAANVKSHTYARAPVGAIATEALI